MKSWVYLFSQFTPEALLFEALLIFVLCAGYTGFWILRKRRLGVTPDVVPAGVVKTYMAQLIADAEEMRTQLFGLLRSAGGAPMPRPQYMPQAAAPAAPPGEAEADPALLEKISSLEAKMGEQATAMQALLQEKERVEKDLVVARNASAKAPSGGDSAALSALQAKIASLEGKLAEYSVIEDDLANLKRLQQENAQLRAALAGQGGAASPPTTQAAKAAPAPAAPAPAAAAPAAPAADEGMAAISEAEATAAAPQADAGFEGLVDQVEQSLQPAAAQPAAAPVSTPAAAPATMESNDADLVAEFEKMLKT
jgi:hypothetical protein